MARVACFYLIGIGAAYLQARTMAGVTQGTMRHLRTELFEHMESLPIKYFDTHAHGDIMSVYTNDVEIIGWRMDGETDWTQREVSFAGGENTVKWVYYKDKSGTEGEDCAWVDGVTWNMSGGSTDVVVDVGGGKTVTVPATWFADKTGRAATDVAANGRKVWECYMVGLDPESDTNDFKIVSFPMGADGLPDISAIRFDPPQTKWNVQGATPVLKGKASLDGGEWHAVTDENKSQMRFFRVEVELP